MCMCLPHTFKKLQVAERLCVFLPNEKELVASEVRSALNYPWSVFVILGVMGSFW